MRFSSFLLTAAAISAGAAGSQAAQIYSATFDSQTGTSVNGVTGGTATLKSTGLGTCTVETANSLGDGGYLSVTLQPSANYNVTTKLTPASAANSMNALISNSGTALNGGFDFFMRVSRSIGGDLQTPASLYVDPPTNGASIGASGGWASNSFFGMSAQAPNTFSNWDEQVGSQYANGTSVKIGNQTTKNLVPGTIYHMAAWLSTDVNGLVTAKYFIREGTGAIDTSSDTDLTGRVTFNVNAPGGLTTGEMDFGTAGNWGSDQAPITIDYDSFRMYDAAPASFAAIAAVPEPATLSLLGLGAVGLLSRRRSV